MLDQRLLGLVQHLSALVHIGLYLRVKFQEMREVRYINRLIHPQFLPHQLSYHLDKSNFNAVKSLVEVSVGSTTALHQIMLVQDETDIYVQQLPYFQSRVLSSVGSTNGIGTFGGEYSGE
jgi:hypothetical protein